MSILDLVKLVHCRSVDPGKRYHPRWRSEGDIAGWHCGCMVEAQGQQHVTRKSKTGVWRDCNLWGRGFGKLWLPLQDLARPVVGRKMVSDFMWWHESGKID